MVRHMNKPEWTTITDNPDSWPELDEECGVDSIEIVCRFPQHDGTWGSLEAFEWDRDIEQHIRDGDRVGYIGGIYRHADDYDSPPTEK